MKKLIGIFAVLLLSALPAVAQVPRSQSNQSHVAGVYVSENYGYWSDKIASGSVAAASPATLTMETGSVVIADNRNFVPFYVNEVVNIGAGANEETVTLTAVSGCYLGAAPNTCQISGNTSNAHGQGELVTSGTFGLDEAAYDANSKGGGVVMVSVNSNATNTQLAAVPTFANVTIEDNRGPSPAWWSVQPSALTALATPAVRVAAATCTALANAVCDSTAVGTWTNTAYYVCVTYVDIQGQESPCSATANYTSAGSVAIQFNSPAASTGAVGWRAYAGTSYAAAYALPVTAARCTLTTLETIQPACAMGAVGTFPTPTTTTKLHPGYVVATYNPNDLSHTTFAYQLSSKPPSICSLESNFGPFLVTAGGTTTQQQVVGSVELAAGCLNQIGRTIRITGKINDVAGSGETPTIKVMLGPIFTTGTPTSVCTTVGTTTTGAGVTTNDYFSCIMTVNATGATGSIQPDGIMIVQNTAGTVTASTIAVDTGVAAITSNVLAQDTLYIVYIPTSATNTSAQLLDLHIEDL